ncbi:methylated-DNA--[protein]-cysteine S-methyltransferase [Algoriphagus sp. AGSA1]|uniref:methylated-DNA--[protein]-cysteine S-methyltransferase n=1 Tax=Algoriphagus sp. AGSA1 TaxID=2907213 RepID=UPI001F26138F|nr:methylated-DNA--[protein]-cysteine S-methyltransferase [Algoriphagus sp. AGSA1]MCE7053873.1 methylated-DNA--[protein]-cysteine S-methyltransferase [Algoriphagus sp. AGSA1]
MIRYSKYLSPIGDIIICSTEAGICALEFFDVDYLESKLTGYRKHFKQPLIHGSNSHIEVAKNELQEYFFKSRNTFNTSLDPIGTAFQKKVWRSLQIIPYGKTISYSKQALMLGIPGAFRAVASANARNKIAIMLPCHRVIGSNGKLTGYAGGIWRKERLLEIEGVLPERLF